VLPALGVAVLLLLALVLPSMSYFQYVEQRTAIVPGSSRNADPRPEAEAVVPLPPPQLPTIDDSIRVSLRSAQRISWPASGPLTSYFGAGHPTGIDIGLRAGFYGCFPLIVSFFFGLDPTIEMLLVPIFCFVTALGFAAFGLAVAASVAKIDQFNYVTTLLITPLFLVAGTFFPIDDLPQWAQIVAQFNPLHQLVELVRNACFGFEATDLLRVAGLLAFAVAMWRFGVRRLTRRLID
jgi:hypothetical protein